ncbi:Prolow-density lipoprotein receptor-related protein 1 [Eumeta japonica]|uniref:Prolow-density lipoprotein receptor-related protein 1 n=1 Tax=Eumeta variegata TaxID=151549 RepID=A0A4C1VCP6_EUMVA|nr:Prolow-density lipoprotein receptor-related protein 1 [Eumeta japonica]
MCISCHAAAAGTCAPGQFQCARGACIAAGWRCDGDPDCGPADASDEDPYLCEKDFRCPPNQARCFTPIGGSFTCVRVDRFCDSNTDCPDNSDEWSICGTVVTRSDRVYFVTNDLALFEVVRTFQ